jgi:tellurite resistance protein
MFLQELTTEEKVAFLELAHIIANSNGIIDESEQKMLDSYDLEMGLDLKIEDLNELSLSTIVPIFKSERTKRIVFLEAIAIAFADGIYDEEQKNLIQELKIAFNISDEDYQEFKGWIIKVNSLYAQADELVGA